MYKQHALAIFVHGFAKKDQANIDSRELAGFKALAAQLLSYEADEIARAVASGTLIEVVRSEEDEAIS